MTNLVRTLTAWMTSLLMVLTLIPAMAFALPATSPVLATGPGFVQGSEEGGDEGEGGAEGGEGDYVEPAVPPPAAPPPAAPLPPPAQETEEDGDSSGSGGNGDEEDGDSSGSEDAGEEDGDNSGSGGNGEEEDGDDGSEEDGDTEDVEELQPTRVVETDNDDEDLAEGLDTAIVDQAIVKLGDDVDPFLFAERTGTTLIRIILTGNILQLELDPDMDDDVELDALLDDPDVVWAEFNFTSQAPEGRPRYFFTSSTGVPQLVDEPNLPDGLGVSAANTCSTGEGVVVAVVDTGVDPDHPLLANRIAPGGFNLLDSNQGIEDIGNDRDDDGDGQVDEMVGHGTHVGGTILQVAPDAMILPIKVLDSDGVGDAFALTAGIFHAVSSGADVINLSLGSTYDSLAVQAAVAYAEQQGVVVVAAAGNGDRDDPLEYPASTESVISVASTTSDGDKADFSNYNASVDLSAPGIDVASAYPGGLFSTASGTSMSTPLVAGTVALMMDLGLGPEPGLYASILANTSGPFDLSDDSLDGMLGAGILAIDDALSCSEA